MTATGSGQAQEENTQTREPSRGYTFGALKSSFRDIGLGISSGTDKISDVFVDESEEGRRARGERLKKETVTMVKDIASHIKSNMEGTSIKSLMCDVSYGAARLSRKVGDIDFANILYQTCHGAGRASRMTRDALWGSG